MWNADEIQIDGSADITVDSMMVERTGLAQDAVFSSLDVLDGATSLPLNNSSKTSSKWGNRQFK